MESDKILSKKELESINCTQAHYKILHNLIPVFVPLSLMGMFIWWFAFPLAFAMAMDAFVVIFRRRKCTRSKGLVKFVLSFCILFAIILFISFIVLIYYASIRTESIWTDNKLLEVFLVFFFF